MPNIVKGGDMAGLLRYLAGPGRAEEHTNPRVIAGDLVTTAVYAGRIDVARATELAKLLDSPRQVLLRGAPVMATNYRQAYAAIAEGTPRQEAFEAATKDENVWHCALSLDPKEGQLDEEKWAAISRRFMAEMGFTDAADGAPDVRWAAVHHGLTKAGGDHVHIAMSVVRPDGSLADVRRDWPRSQAAVRVLEKEFGLKVLASREHGATEYASRPDERARALRVGAVETDREALRRRVRAAAVASGTEAEFVRELRAEGVMVAPRYRAEDRAEVVGYKVRMPAQKNLATGKWEKAIWFAPYTELAKDLSLPSLRSWAGWPDTVEDRQAAVAEWDRAATTRSGRSLRPNRVSERDAIDTLARWSESMRAIPVEDRAGWAEAASRTAGLFAAASLRTETTPGPLDRLSRQLARHGQLPAHQRRREPEPGAGIRAVARMLWSMSSPAAATLALIEAMAECASAVSAMLEASERAVEARELAGHTRAALIEIHKRAAGIDPRRPHVREPGSPAWVAEERAAALLGGRDRAGVEAAIVEQQQIWHARRVHDAGRPGYQHVDALGHPTGPKPDKPTRKFVVQRRSGTPAPTDNAARITVAAVTAAEAEAAAAAEAREALHERTLRDLRSAREQSASGAVERSDDRFGDLEDDPYASPSSTPPRKSKSLAAEREWERNQLPPERPERGGGVER